MARGYHTTLALRDVARALREEFQERYAAPRSTRGDRFVWDYWHVPGQYTQLRTPAEHFFSEQHYAALVAGLTAYGREHLGCPSVSFVWLSAYIDGCEQHLHGDLPHGPWAFVLSLTDWKRRVFRGGETLLLRDEVLDWWSGFESVRGVEREQLLHAIEPQLGRMLVFDPRIPHGVARVSGTHDLREARLVVHGWFTPPAPMIEGPLRERALHSGIQAVLEDLPAMLPESLQMVGTLCFRLQIDADGTCSKVRVLSDTTRVPAADESQRLAVLAKLAARLRRLKLGKSRGPSIVTLPFVLER